MMFDKLRDEVVGTLALLGQIYGDTQYIKTKMREIQSALEPAAKLAQQEVTRRERMWRILMVSYKNGQLEHKLFTQGEFHSYFGGRYSQAIEEFDRNAYKGHVTYIDGALVMWTEMSKVVQDNVKRWQLQ